MRVRWYGQSAFSLTGEKTVFVDPFGDMSGLAAARGMQFDYPPVAGVTADLLLVIEVADTSLEADREVKRPLYAENGIAEYWIVNLAEACIEVHRQPRADGTYQEVRTLRRGQTLDVAALPGCTLAVDQVV